MTSVKTLPICAVSPLPRVVQTAGCRTSGHCLPCAKMSEVFVRTARSRVFLLERRHLRSHAARLREAAPMLWHGDELRAVVPAHHIGNDVVAQGELCCDEQILDPSTGAQQTLNLREQMPDPMRELSVHRPICKWTAHVPSPTHLEEPVLTPSPRCVHHAHGPIDHNRLRSVAHLHNGRNTSAGGLQGSMMWKRSRTP